MSANHTGIRPGPDDVYLPQLFQRAGYVTGQIGKLEWGFATTGALSEDGAAYTQIVSNGSWCEDTSLKSAVFSPVEARYIRLEAVSGGSGQTSCAELNIGYWS
jgi:hypothetical protein